MPKNTEFVQPDSYIEPHTEYGVSLKEQKERIIKRATLEILPSLMEWAKNKDSLTQMAIKGTLTRPSLYETVPPSQWRGVIEEFTERSLEVIILPSPLTNADLLRIGQKKSLVLERITELNQTLPDTLLLIWHQNHGLLACSEGPFPKGFPKLSTYIQFQTSQKQSPKLWGWYKQNFLIHD